MATRIAVILILHFGGSTMALAAEPEASQTPIWIDVRTVHEDETGHLPGAINIGFERIAPSINEITVDKNAALWLYCQSGRRSGLAKQTLEKLDYANVVNAGGLKLVLRNAQTKPVARPDCAANNC